MARFTNRTTGVVVDVSDDKAMGPDWEPAKAEKPKATPRKSDVKK